MSGAPHHPIAIAGMHRSGTSMVTRALHDAGLHLIGSDEAELISAAEDNPEGFWENRAIVACNDELLEATGGAWDHPPDVPPLAADDPRVAHLVGAAEAALDGLRVHERWGFKDPRVCLTAPFWLDLEPELRFVICLRHPIEVALSLKRRNQNTYSLGLALWERYYASILATVPPERRIVSHYDAFFVDPERELARVCHFAGLEPAEASVRHDLRHHTMELSLTDAGVSPTLRALYADLCVEAGMAPPVEPVADEGRVRRLILDGAVAAQHAEQRQAAIARLEAREREFRAEHAANEEALRARVRDLERQLSETRAVALRKVDQMAKQLQVVHHEVTPGPVRRRFRRVARKALRVGRDLATTGRRRAVPVARRTVAQLPAPTQEQLRRARRGLRAPGPSARAVGREAAPALRAAAHRLPPPAEQRLRVTWVRVQRVRRSPVPTAKRAVRRLPEPTQAATVRIWRRSAPVRRKALRLSQRLELGARLGPRTPLGAPVREWKQGYRDLVRSTVPAGAEWLVLVPGSPGEVRDAGDPKGVRFPARTGPQTDDLAYIAALEAQRFAGHRYLVVPEGSRRWLRQHAQLRDHLVHTYECLEDRSDAGAVFALTPAGGETARSLRTEVERLATGLDGPVAVLDWTDLDLAAELPGATAFRPPEGARLPYLDDSIDVVVRDEDRDPSEARRVAARGVVTVAGGPGGAIVRSVEELASAAPVLRARVLVRSHAADPDEAWVTALTERVALAGATLALGAEPPVDPRDHDVVVVVEPGVVPLPGAIEAAAELAAAWPDTAIAGKVLRADGRLDSAGGTVFFDRSVAPVAAGTADVTAPWHDYLRPVCWAPGFAAASTELWRAVPGPEGAPERTFLREWCAGVWARGGTVVYEPTAVAVRVTGNGGEPALPLQSSAWQRVLDLRPRRPEQLGDGEWRYLLAHDDVEACRG